MSLPPKRILPLVGRSRHPTIFTAVDFPEPEGPMMETNSPFFISSFSPVSAFTFTSPRS